jgi:predicted metal-dependent peptidase
MPSADTGCLGVAHSRLGLHQRVAIREDETGGQNMTNNDERFLRLDKARWWILTEQPFYGQLLMTLPDTLSDSVPTAQTDGKCIMWGADFLDSLGDSELRFVMLHEVLHIALGHPWRFPGNTPRENIACDHAINLLLRQVAGVSMPPFGVADPQYAGLAEEEILRRLPEDAPQDGCGGYVIAADTADKAGDESLRDAWERRVIQAAQTAKALGRGHIPGEMERVLRAITHQRIDWRAELADFIRSVVGTRNDWSRCHRRHAHGPVIYPRRRPDEVATVVFVRDTSGSIDAQTLGEFSGLIEQCMSEMGYDAIVLDADAAVCAEYRLAPGDACPALGTGGGGTDFHPALRRALDLRDAGEHIGGVVYLTDLCGPGPSSYDLPLLWLCTTDLVAPTGRTVRIEP